MCSVSWIYHDRGYDLFFNRDEQRSRPAALPPQLHKLGNLPVLAPVDPQSGGTWIYTNSAGVTVCLLNAYGEVHMPDGPLTSRGKLMLELAYGENFAQTNGNLRMALYSWDSSYAPFYLLILDLEGNRDFSLWNGYHLSQPGFPRTPFHSTSSYESRKVLLSRRKHAREAIKQNGYTPDTLRQLHLAPGQPADASTIKMSREDAKTVSFTQVTVTQSGTQMHYAPRPDDQDFQNSQSWSLGFSRS